MRTAALGVAGPAGILLALVGLVGGATPAPVGAQDIPDVPVFFEGNSNGEEYMLKSLLLGVPGLILTAANASVVPAGGPGLGVLGLGVGVAQVAYGADGFGRHGVSDFVSGFNVAAGVAGILAGLWQIRGTGGGDTRPGTMGDDGDREVGVRLIPGPEGAAILLSWRW